jgi:hypothetical protein
VELGAVGIADMNELIFAGIPFVAVPSPTTYWFSGIVVAFSNFNVFEETYPEYVAEVGVGAVCVKLNVKTPVDVVFTLGFVPAVILFN